jgi:hypothetical protein
VTVEILLLNVVTRRRTLVVEPSYDLTNWSQSIGAARRAVCVGLTRIGIDRSRICGGISLMDITAGNWRVNAPQANQNGAWRLFLGCSDIKHIGRVVKRR